jgi:hypothetical protein
MVVLTDPYYVNTPCGYLAGWIGDPVQPQWSSSRKGATAFEKEAAIQAARRLLCVRLQQGDDSPVMVVNTHGESFAVFA